jgi:reverse gyrase
VNRLDTNERTTSEREPTQKKKKKKKKKEEKEKKKRPKHVLTRSSSTSSHFARPFRSLLRRHLIGFVPRTAEYEAEFDENEPRLSNVNECHANELQADVTLDRKN